MMLLIDGACGVCRHEAALLHRLDKRRRLTLVDIADPSFDPSVFGLTMAEVMAAMHGILPDGRVITGLEVFRRAYSLVGWGWLWAPTGWPGLRPLADAGYRLFARNRTLFGRKRCTDGSCRVQA